MEVADATRLKAREAENAKLEEALPALPRRRINGP
jgi:hypothetical protein